MALVGRTTNALHSFQTYAGRQDQSLRPPLPIPHILVAIDVEVDDYQTLIAGLQPHAAPLIIKTGEGLST